MLFKILKGDSERISTDVTEFHEGYAYYTSDDGGFYIDSTNGSTRERKMINPKSKQVTCTLSVSGWKSGTQTVKVSGVTSSSNGVATISQSATTTQLAAAKEAGIRATAQGNGTVTFSADKTPSVDIPVQILIVP